VPDHSPALPLTAILLVNQRSPYQTLVCGGVPGRSATLVYCAAGAADVALTEGPGGHLAPHHPLAIALALSMVFRLELRQGSSLAPKAGASAGTLACQQAFLRLGG